MELHKIHLISWRTFHWMEKQTFFEKRVGDYGKLLSEKTITFDEEF
jgi:hypothetical protein